MIVLPGDPRRVVPRWHSPDVSAQRPDTHSLRRGTIPKAPAPDTREVLRRAADFRTHPDDAHAGDLLSVALIARQPEIAHDAAHWILKSDTASTLMRHLATRALKPDTPESQERLAVPTDVSGTNRDRAGERIRTLRARLALVPQDPMSWAELARQHTLTGHLKKAKDAMRVAVAGAPSDRYLLRSSARLMHHTGDLEQAHALLARAPRTPTDPWLIAGEITLAGIAGRPARFLRTGRRLLEEAGIPPVHLSELASALATIELDTGHAVHARRLFRKALKDPNDNALAQAEWAAGIIKLDVEPQLLSIPSSWEARALAAAAADEAESTISEAWGWFYDQPFASGPAVFGSYQASKHGQFADGARFAEAGIAANPGSFLLHNNLAFCLAKLGNIARAEHELSLIHTESLDRGERGTIQATRGLIAFRSGNPRAGTEHYREALSMLPTRETCVLALINLAIETFRVDPALGEPLARQSSRGGRETRAGCCRPRRLAQATPGRPGQAANRCNARARYTLSLAHGPFSI